MIVVTNQPDVRTGVQTRTAVDEIHRELQEQLSIDAIETCFHVDADDCPCRKPKPGMLLRAAARFDLDLGRSFLVGDRWRDIGAGQAVGCKSYWIDRGYREPAPEPPHQVVSGLPEAGSMILASLNTEGGR